MRDEIGDEREPEGAQLRQHTPLVGDARAEHVVERRDAIGGDNQQPLGVHVVHVTDLAATMQRERREGCVEKGLSLIHI